MNKCLDTIKEEVVRNSKSIPIGKAMKIIIKPTKKKTFLASVEFYKLPMFSLFINNRLYGTYIYHDRKWTEELVQ
jgi:hypothetical protein